MEGPLSRARPARETQSSQSVLPQSLAETVEDPERHPPQNLTSDPHRRLLPQAAAHFDLSHGAGAAQELEGGPQLERDFRAQPQHGPRRQDEDERAHRDAPGQPAARAQIVELAEAGRAIELEARFL